jgi:signal transduction histidine kinase
MTLRAKNRARKFNVRRQRLTIKAHLIRLVLVSLLPAAGAAVMLIGYSYQRQQEAIHQNTLATARALTQAVDRELASGRTALQALATSPYLSSGDLRAFHAQAILALPELPGNNVVLSDAFDGQQLVNTLRGFGEPLPLRANLPLMRRMIQTGQPLVSDLFIGQVALRPLISVEVPVRREGRIAYALAMGFFPERLAEILNRQQLPANWIGVIFDSQGTVVARTLSPDRYVGHKGGPALVTALAQHMEGELEGDTLEGIPVHTVFSRSSESNWSVAIGIPRAEFEWQLYSSLLWVVAGTLVLLVLGLVFARRLAERVQGAIRGLIPPATALARGEAVSVAPLQLAEAEEVAAALASASKILRDREEILAVVTHDLRSPLNTMTMLASVAELEGRKQGNERWKANALLMRETVRSMSGLVDDLLAITVAHHGQSMLKRICVSADRVLGKAVQAARPQFEHAGLALEVDAPDELPGIQVDVDRIVRVFRNLLDNALKFTEPQGRVLVQAGARPDCVRFCIANSGSALAREQLDSMFQLFWQAQSDRRGTGLGLSISRAIVETHMGRIWAEPAEGMRVRICIELPFAGGAEGQHEPAVEMSGPSPATSLPPRQPPDL